MGANLKLIARSLVDMRGTQHIETLDLGWQRHRTIHHRTGTFCSFNNSRSRLVDQAIIKRLEANADFLTLHNLLLLLRGNAANLKNKIAWPGSQTQPTRGRAL